MSRFALCKIDIYYACVASKLTYSLCTLCLTEKQMRLLDSLHIGCLRSIAGIPSTWGAAILGMERISNEQVRCQANVKICRMSSATDDSAWTCFAMVPQPPSPRCDLQPFFTATNAGRALYEGSSRDLMLVFKSQRPLLTTITSRGQAWRSIFFKNF